MSARRLLTVAEVAEQLQVSQIWVRRSKIAKTYCGRHLRYTQAAVDAFIVENTQTPMPLLRPTRSRRAS